MIWYDPPSFITCFMAFLDVFSTKKWSPKIHKRFRNPGTPPLFRNNSYKRFLGALPLLWISLKRQETLFKTWILQGYTTPGKQDPHQIWFSYEGVVREWDSEMLRRRVLRKLLQLQLTGRRSPLRTRCQPLTRLLQIQTKIHEQTWDTTTKKMWIIPPLELCLVQSSSIDTKQLVQL